MSELLTYAARIRAAQVRSRESGASADRRRIRRQRERQAQHDAEAQSREDRKRELLDAAVGELSKYSWSYFVTLTFRDEQGPESIERAIKRFTRFVHENCFGEFAVTDVRDLYGIRYSPAIERGCCGEKRLHAHLVICGGEGVGDRLKNALWTPWREWWNKEYRSGLRIEKPHSQERTARYLLKYMLKGEDFAFELCSTWADERDRRKRYEAPLFEDRKVGCEVAVSAELERTAFRGEWPRGAAPAAIISARPCHRCGLVRESLCRCWTGTAESGEVYGPQLDAGACTPEIAACRGESGEVGGSHLAPLSPPSMQLSLPLQKQLVLPLHASASKTVLSFRRRERLLRRRRRLELRSATRYAVRVAVNAVCNVPRSVPSGT